MTPILLIIKLLREGLDRILIPKKSCVQMFSTVLRPFAETRFNDPNPDEGTITPSKFLSRLPMLVAIPAIVSRAVWGQ